ncbi:ATP-binding protein [uncultured Sphingomonas sp.]|uniref:ATP-binding protein n=1 Tax=uncultured Sphingomonas sp. TaxID=158754 RepID=UPI0035C948E4
MGGTEDERRLVARVGAAWRGITLTVMALLGLAVGVALFVTLGEANRQRDRALELQSHSYDVMILSRTLSGTMARAEAALGRYVISGDKLPGREFSEDWQAARQQLERLAGITADNREQQAAIARLRSVYQRRGDELQVTALTTFYGKNAQAFARFYRAGTSTSLMEIDRLLDRIIANEHALLDVRTGAAMASVTRSNKVAGVLGGFGLLIVIGAAALGWLTISAIHERATAEADAEQERERTIVLELAVSEATLALQRQEAQLRQSQKMEAVGQLTGGIAHDFNNMLAVVIGGLELARRSLDRGIEDVRRHLDSATEGANRAAALTRRLLAFARDEALNPEALLPLDAIAGMSDLLDRTLGDGVIVAATDDGSAWRVWADRHELENTLLNLAVNARDAMAERGTLSVHASATTLAAGEIGKCRAGDYVAIAVTDTGCGMTQDIVDRVFEPFFTTKPVGKGTGLGLSQIFAFARQSEGEVAIRSTPGEGTTVTLYLPRHVAPVLAAMPVAAGRQPGPAQVAARPMSAGLQVLVVEDDPRVLAATIGALQELGHHAVPCPDPLDAPRVLEGQDPFDLVVSDVLMPGQTGPEMVAGLLATRPDLAVLFVTGFAGDGATADFGGLTVLRKPFTLAGLERAIAEALAVDRPTMPDRVAAE